MPWLTPSESSPRRPAEPSQAPPCAGSSRPPRLRGCPDGDRDRPRQERAQGLRVRRHRDRALAAYARPRRHRHLLEARPIPVRAADGRLGGLAVLNLEGIFARYEDAESELERIAALPKEQATREMQDIYREPVKPELIARRIREIKEQKVVVAASLTPQRVLRYHEIALEAGLDVLVIQGTVVSGEHVSTVSEPLNLKEFIPTLDVPVVVGGCASYHTGLHLMRTGAAGVLVGVGPGAACTTRGVLGIGVPQATAIADVAHARSTHMLETGEYCQVIADGGMRNGGDVAKAIALGADAVMIGSPLARAYEAPGRGFHWGMATFHPTLPRGARVATAQNGTLEEILVGPARENDGTFNLFGGLRTSMATCGHKDLAEFNRAEVVIAPALQTEGKALQRDQGVGMGATNGKAAALAND